MKIGSNHTTHCPQPSRPNHGPAKSTGNDDPGSSGPRDRADISDRVQETLSHLQERMPLQNLISNIQGNFSQQ